MRYKIIALAILTVLQIETPVTAQAAAQSARILAIEATDDATHTATTDRIDTVQGLCGTASSATAEPFYDTALRIKVMNLSNAELLINKFSYSVHNFDGTGKKLNAVPLALVSTGRV